MKYACLGLRFLLLAWAVHVGCGLLPLYKIVSIFRWSSPVVNLVLRSRYLCTPSTDADTA